MSLLIAASFITASAFAAAEARLALANLKAGDIYRDRVESALEKNYIFIAEGVGLLAAQTGILFYARKSRQRNLTA